MSALRPRQDFDLPLVADPEAEDPLPGGVFSRGAPGEARAGGVRFLVELWTAGGLPAEPGGGRHESGPSVGTGCQRFIDAGPVGAEDLHAEVHVAGGARLLAGCADLVQDLADGPASGAVRNATGVVARPDMAMPDVLLRPPFQQDRVALR